MPSSESSNNIVVAVRARSLPAKEKCAYTLEMQKEGGQVKGTDAKTAADYNFRYDHCFWSVDASLPCHASQAVVFETIGGAIVDGVFDGYNCSVFAYGQTGSGKTYTMMGGSGAPEEEGLIPRTCRAIFQRVEVDSANGVAYELHATFMEIYNEQVHDLLGAPPATAAAAADEEGSHPAAHLKVREHSVTGPYVEGLTVEPVRGFADVQRLLGRGNEARATAATGMNAQSSRSHAIFTFGMRQTLLQVGGGERAGGPARGSRTGGHSLGVTH
jgi:hypothetical protein